MSSAQDRGGWRGSALATGSIDAINTWEPHVANGRRALGDRVAPLDTKPDVRTCRMPQMICRLSFRSDPAARARRTRWEAST
ncbi:hypothetical protein AwMethylo_11380 [Methylobacterium sp.]|nr:hypothetical protein AwMethylo_11380 [Methylobacterium sp.]